MTLPSTPQWRAQLRQFLSRRDWSNVYWADELNQRCVFGNRYLLLTGEGLSRWLNNGSNSAEYRGPKIREDYIGIAHALLQMGIINQEEAREWLLGQGLYPLPHEAEIFGMRHTSISEEASIYQLRLPNVGKIV